MFYSRTFLLLSICAFSFVVVDLARAQGVGSGAVTVAGLVAGCGDELIGGGEDCDTNNLGGASCMSQGFTSGVLSCTASCLYNTTACVYTAPTSGGGGGGSNYKSGAQVVLSGRAYPRSEITVLKDAQVVATTMADDSAHFQVLIKGLSAGTYIFSLYSEDHKGLRSSLFTFPVTVTKGILAKIESIFVAPTITGDKIEVKKGEPIILFGQSTPISEVTVEVNSNEPFFFKTNSGSDGVYLKSVDSSVFELGQHHAKARSSLNQVISPQSAVYEFTVGTKTVLANTVLACSKKADLNGDCRVNLIDFSIVAFWYLRPLTQSFIERDTAHLNGDGKVTLIDFSIMAFYWTG